MKTLNLCLGFAWLLACNSTVAAVADRFGYPIGNGNRYTEANDGDGWYVAQEFGDWNSSFSKYHLGEDWNAESGGNTDCGLPVYAVANGTIVCATNASGWGRVLIVRHTLPDGRQVESLYGHLASFAKTSGDVVRGEQVGTIGDGHEGGTTYPCHLHLEIRTAACTNWGQPGPGYSITPTPVGWTDPSAFLDAYAGVDLSGSWSLKGRDTAGTVWYADLIFVQTNDASGKHLTGHFDWDTANIGAFSYGREYFTGTFDEPQGTIRLVGYRLENYGGRLGTGDYLAKVSPDGLLFYDGSWVGATQPGIPSYDWSAVLCRVVDSSFQSNLDDWQLTGNGTLAWQGSGGDPGGYASAQNAATGAVLRLVAPTNYLGGWRFAAQVPGLISIDTRLFSYSGSRNSGPAFRISGPGGTAEIVRPVAAGPSQSQWQTLVVPLDPSFWTVTSGTWNQLLTNVTYFDVNGEFASGGSSDGFDNIRLLLPGREMDVTPARVASMSPNPGSVLLESPGTIDLSFTESLDVRTLSPRTIRLLRSGGDSSFDQGNEVVVPFSALTWTSPTNLRCTLGGAGLPNDVYELVLNGWESRYCLFFDGSDAYVRVPNAAALNPTAAITVEAWVNPASFQDWGTVVVKCSNPYWNDGYGLAHYTGANDINFFANSFSGPHASGTLPAGQWSHVAGTYDGSQVKLYINGQLVSSVAQSGAIRSSASDLTIGWSVGNGFWRGSIDDVRIWNAARTAEDIRRNMYGLLSGNESGLVASWAFDEGTGQVLNDQSPYHHDGTLGANSSTASDDPEWTVVKSITDMAGNALDGEFSGGWPSGDGQSGGDFRARFSVQPTVSNVRANQRPGTTLVDLFYDLSGAGSGYSVSVTVSSDGGASFSVPATHFTGDGVTTPAAPGTGRHIVWDAGADFPAQFSTKMRLKVADGSAFAVSSIFTVDTRTAQTGTLTGLVQGSGAPVANAQARIDGTGFAASTGTDGRFTLANVPTGSGYLLKVSAAGFASKPVPGITVTNGTKDLGTIQLAPLAGPYRVVPLQPDVNPPTTRIEDGGVAYRYYRVITANGSAPAGQVPVSLLAAGGGTIPQGGDTSIYWAGYQAGISDDDGIVRLLIPSSAVGGPGLSATLQVVQAGTVATTFSAQVVPRTYYQVWKHKVGGGASGNIAAWKVGGSAALETELRHRWHGNAVPDETIEAKWEAQGRAGLEISTPGMKLGSLKTGAGLEAGGYLGVDIASRHNFLADTSDEVLNLYKVLVALGGPMVESDGPAHSLADLLSAYYGVDLLQATLVGTSGAIHLGGYADGEALFEAGSFGNLNAKVGGEFDANLGGFAGYEDTKIPAEHATVLGLEAELSGSVGGMLGYMKYNQSKLRGLGLQFAGTVGQTLTGRAVAPAGSPSPYRVEVEFRGSSESGIDLSLIGWKGLGGTLAPNLWVETSETLTYDLPTSDSMDKLAALGSAWQLLKTGFTGQSQLKPQHADDLVGGILDAPDAENNVLGYARTLYTATIWEMPLEAEVQAIAGGLGLSLDAKVERGAEGVLEQGQIWHSLRMPLQWYPNTTAGLIPSDTLLTKEAVWIKNALPHLNSALHRATVIVSSVTGAGVSAGNAALQFGGGVMDEGAQLTSMWWQGLWSGGSGIHLAARQVLRDPMYGQSSLVPSNYVYGIGGIYRFESTNAFHWRPIESKHRA